jgi:16S rRNA (cytidine1402-2'-O)-methyltransferase
VARELTKLHEEWLRGPLGELAARFAEAPPRGEITLVVAGAPEEPASTLDVEAEVRRRLDEGQGAREIAAGLALITGHPRRAIYQLALALKPR